MLNWLKKKKPESNLRPAKKDEKKVEQKIRPGRMAENAAAWNDRFRRARDMREDEYPSA